MKPKLYFARLIKDIAVGRMEEWRNGGTEEWNVGRMEEWESGMLRRWPKFRFGGRRLEECDNLKIRQFDNERME